MDNERIAVSDDFFRLFQDTTDAMCSLVQAKNVRDTEREKCDFDWGYFGHSIESRLRDKEIEVASGIQAMIDNRIKAYFEKQNSNSEE